MFTFMGSSSKRALLAGVLVLSGAGVSLADYNTGSQAFTAGNYTRAYQEFSESADAGNSLAQFMMGRLYAEGRGVNTDKVKAYMWFDLSASNGNTRAIAQRDAIAARLSSSEIDRAQDMAAAWRTEHPGSTISAPSASASAPTIAPYSLRNVQVALATLGYNVGTPDGIIGPKSRTAIRAFQVDSALPESGEPSIALYEKLQAAIVERSGATTQSTQAATTASKSMISEAQTELRRRGYAISAITGVADAETVAAVRDYQADAQLPVTGDINDALLQQLRPPQVDTAALYRAQVKRVQAVLNAAGYSAGPADGALGPRSRTAISRYQSDNNLAVTGDVNEALLASLGINGAEQRTDATVSGATIRETKRQLQVHGYASGTLNGILDPATRDAIRAYQRDAGLPVTGEPSPDLLEHLRQSDTRTNQDSGAQRALNIEDELQRHGYAVGPVDGVIDQRSRNAIRAYQADAGLPITGRANEALLAQLQASDVRSLPTSTVVEIQSLLNRLGYLNAKSDGMMGPRSIAAIRRYQGDRGLAVTGVPSIELLSTLRAERISEPDSDNP
jgi:peptidoglycan hydrolase-like protein with peptidoglycan-binding domain